jgi:hypothetical protein
VEAGTNVSASLLRFQSSGAALLLGIATNYAHQQRTSTVPAGNESSNQYRIDLRVGARKYASTDARVRPFVTVSGLGGTSQTFGREWHAGADLEIGAAYFFSPHVSLGGSGSLSALYSHAHADFASGDIETTKTFSMSGGYFRLLGAVYF